MIINSPFPDVNIEKNISFPDFIQGKLRQYGSKTAVIDSTNGRKYAYTELLDLTQLFRYGFCSLNLTKGDVVSVCLTNCVEIFPIALAVTSQGAIFNTSNPTYTPDELIYQYRLVKSKYLVTNKAIVDKIITVKAACPTVQGIIVIDGNISGCLSLYELAEKGKNEARGGSPRSNVDPSDVAFLFSSSGTTGLPKQIMLTHLNLVANLSQLSQAESTSKPGMRMFSPGPTDLVFSVFPYFHLAGLLNGLVWVLKEGGCSIILPKYDTKTFIHVIETYKPNILIAPPPIHVFLTKSKLAEQADLSSIKFVVNRAAPIAPSVAEALCKRLSLPYIVNGYGMTELSTIGLIIPICELSRSKFGSCGVPLPNSRCKVVDVESGKTVGANKRGQLLMNGLHITKGYLYNQAATEEAIDSEGWLSTGDICYYDDDGYFYIVDRIKEMIKVKGFQVAPAEIEQCLLCHASIADTAVVGILDEYAGELPFAFVVKKPDAQLSEDEVKKFVAEHLAAYKHLKGGVRFVEAIPKNPSGKILRRLLRDQIRRERAEKNNEYSSKL